MRLAGYEGARIGVLGLARGGLAAVRALIASGAEVAGFDDRAEALDAARALGAAAGDAARLGELDALIVSPGVPLTPPHPLVARARAARVAIGSDIDLFRSAIGARRLIGVTGSNGKSSVTTLLASALREAGIDALEGGNIGAAALDLDPGSPRRRFVIELSSFQLDLAAGLRADLALLTNLSPDHLDRHGAMANYVAAKARLFGQQPPQARAILGVDDHESARLVEGLRARGRDVVAISGGRAIEGGVGVEGGVLIDRLDPEKPIRFDLADCPALQGRARAQNAAIVWAAARLEGAAPDAIGRALEGFRGLAHRYERVASAAGVVFVDDSKATNVASAKASLEGGRDLFWIAGGKAKGEDFAPLAPAARQAARRAYLIGESAPALEAALSGVDCAQAGDLDQAIELAAKDARQAGGTVLLAPACASFDQFRNFEARGDAFKARARAIARAWEAEP